MVASDDVLSSNVSGEVAILSLSKGEYYGLSTVGVVVWESADLPRSVEDIRDLIVARFEVEPKPCERDLIQLLADMEATGLIRVLA